MLLLLKTGKLCFFPPSRLVGGGGGQERDVDISSHHLMGQWGGRGGVKDDRYGPVSFFNKAPFLGDKARILRLVCACVWRVGDG